MMPDKVNILIVDDQPDKLLALKTILDELNENIVTVLSGRDALRHLLENEFAVILLDINMPDMDGFETAALIRQHRRCSHTPIIFVTGYADDMMTAHGYALGAVDYVLSPVHPDVLRTKVGVFVELFRKTEEVKRHAEGRVALAHAEAARATAEEAAKRTAFLADASIVLAGSLYTDPTLRELARCAVPFLADACLVQIADEHGPRGPVELAWVDAEQRQQLLSNVPWSAIPTDLRQLMEQVASGEVPEVVRSFHAVPWREAEQCTDANPGPRSFTLHSAVILPLKTQGDVRGILALVMGPSGRGYRPVDISLAKDLVARVATTLENARLYRQIAESDRRKNEFLAILAHELRNPLAPISNAMTVLRQGTYNTETVDWVREVVDRQMQQLVRLVDDLLDISRITRGKIRLQMQPVELVHVIDRAVETNRPLIERRRQVLHCGAVPEAVLVNADSVRLAQAIGNLLNNASKFTEEGGNIWIAAELQGQEVNVRVRDSGIGIPHEMLDTVFDLFTQVERSLDRSYGGLGIGLTLVRDLIGMHGGTVRASSRGPNQGSEFTITLPVFARDRLTSPTDHKSSLDAPITRPLRILVVDDNVDAAETMAMLLRALQHDVLTCHDGATALEQATAYHPDLILLDIGMPGMDGYEVARRMRQNVVLQPATIVALTGYGRAEDRQLSQEAGFDDHLIKPVDTKELLAMVRRCAARTGELEPVHVLSKC